MDELFAVKHYSGDERPIIKGNHFDGLTVGDDREDAEAFIEWVNARIAALLKLEAAAAAVLAYYADGRNDESWHPEFQALRDCFPGDADVKPLPPFHAAPK